jgi:hypothetical protein
MTNHPNRAGKRYDLAFFDIYLMACVPHGANIDAAVRAECAKARIDYETPTIVEGVYLTDDPRDTDEIVSTGNRLGWLQDENGRTYRYAVKR